MKSIKVKTFIPIFNDFYAVHPVTPAPKLSRFLMAETRTNPATIKLTQPPHHCTMAGPFQLE
jgi:hypothetical protein